jgi:TPR repeat protein
MGWIFRIVSLIASWTKIKSSVAQTKNTVQQATSAATGIQHKHAQESLEKAMSGDPEAHYDLGERHYDGRGVPLDYGMAAQWFAKAANLGHSKAQTNLGLMFLVGRGVRKDRDLAIQYLNAAAKQGNETATDTLRKMAKK